MIYDYRKNMLEDIKDYLAENNYTKERLEEEHESGELYNTLFVEDSVTGNASGSYTFCSWTAAEFLLHNEDILVDALKELGGDYERSISEPEYADVTIRCYLLGEVLEDAIEEFIEDNF